MLTGLNPDEAVCTWHSWETHVENWYALEIFI